MLLVEKLVLYIMHTTWKIFLWFIRIFYFSLFWINNNLYNKDNKIIIKFECTWNGSIHLEIESIGEYYMIRLFGEK